MKRGYITPLPLSEKIDTLIQRGDNAGSTLIQGDNPDQITQSFQNAIQHAKKIRDQKKALEQEKTTAY